MIKKASIEKISAAVRIALICCLLPATVWAADLEEIRERGLLRHLGIPYANFVRENDDGIDGLDVEMMRHFAEHLNVRYETITTTWAQAFADLTGNIVEVDGDDVKPVGAAPVRGDILANGLTVLPWRQKLVDYSTPTFPTGVWLVARAGSTIKPIEPTGDMMQDIVRVKATLSGRSVLTMKGTCLDPELYDLASTGADIRYFTASPLLDDIAPAVVEGAAEATLLDIPDALIALQKWPGEIKIVGPVSARQIMGVAVAKGNKELLEEFNRFFARFWNDGKYRLLVEKYYPSVFLYLDDFFQKRLPEK